MTLLEMMKAIENIDKATELVNKLAENGMKFSEAVETAYNAYIK